VRYLIINADGYGFTEGVTRAIEECVAFGTVRSLSANVNFPAAERLADFRRRFPDLSVGCHLNPIVGRPILPAGRVASLLDGEGQFLYRSFVRHFLRGRIRLRELRDELMAQIERTRELAGPSFSHVDFHMGLHRLPRLYSLFLELAAASKTGRIRTHLYRVGLEGRWPRRDHLLHLLRRADRIPKYAWNLALRARAKRRGLAMPDRWVTFADPDAVAKEGALEPYLRLLKNLPQGVSELVVHPAYVDEDLSRWSTWLEPREVERRLLLDTRFRDALRSSTVALAGYRDIPLARHRNGRAMERPAAESPSDARALDRQES
jgi:hypothetical protein